MAQVDLFIDIVRGETIAGVADASIAELPRFVQGDTINFAVYLVKAASRLSAPTRVLTSGVSIQMALGTRVGDETLYYTQQFTWTASTDLADPYWTAQLPMNTEAISSLIDSESSALCWFEVKMIVDGLPTTVLSKQITIQASVIKEGGVVVPAGLTPLSAEAANALFLKRDITGPITLVNGTTGAKVSLYVDDDGTFHADPIA